MLRIFIADDHKILRESLRLLLSQEADLEIVGEAANGREAVAEVRRLKPDVAIIDISLPQLNGVEVAARLKAALPRLKVIILTMHKTEELVRQAFLAGADAYLLKENAYEELRHAITTVAAGGKHISDSVLPMVINGFVDCGSAGRGSGWELMTPREREILQLLAEGSTNKDIAGALNISLKTVDTHRTNIMRKLDLHSISELVLYAVRNHLVEP